VDNIGGHTDCPTIGLGGQYCLMVVYTKTNVPATVDQISYQSQKKEALKFAKKRAKSVKRKV